MGNTQSAPPQCQAGCSPTSAVSQAIAQVQTRQPTVTPDPVSECQANKIKASQLQGQLYQANNTVDTCDPSIPLTRRKTKIEGENSQFVNDRRKEESRLNESIQDKFKTATDLTEAVRLLKQYEKKLKDELATAEKDTMKMEHDERKYRRDFLDSEPTDGVPWHVFGLQTSDDKVMLTFWITALLSFSVLSYIIVHAAFPNDNFKSLALKSAIGVAAALAASYCFIIYMG